MNLDKALDRWSFVHVGSGVLLGALLVPWYGFLALVVGYEGFEAGLRQGRTSKGGIFAPETWQNMVVDILVASVGWGLATWAVSMFWH
jgi:hypothetical protein